MNHVNSKVLIGLATATLLAVLAAVLLSKVRQPESPAETAGYALPELRDHINDVKSLTVIGAENKTLVTLSNGDQGWTVQEKSGYPADTGKLREVLLKLADARLLQAKTANEEKYPDLGVSAIDKKEAKGRMIKLEGLAKPAQLIIGNASSHGNGTFVRRPEDKQSWLTQDTLTIENNPAKWLNTALTDIANNRIAGITLQKGKNQVLRLVKEKPDDAGFQVVDMPKGREPAEPGTVNALASTLTGLTLEDVMPYSGDETKQKPEINAVYRTFDGVIVEADAWQQDDKHYARFTAKLDEAGAEKAVQAEIDKANSDYETLLKVAKDSAAKQEGSDAKPSPEPVKPEAVADSAKYRQSRLDTIKAEIESLKQKFGQWQFVIPAHKYANMDKTLEDVLKPKSSAVKKSAKKRK